MDISQILPLLLKGDDNDQKSKLMSAMLSGGKQEDILAAMGGSGSGNPAEILSNMKGGGGSTPDMLALMNMMKMNKKKTPEKSEGLNTISEFAPPDILGTIFKMLNAI